MGVVGGGEGREARAGGELLSSGTRRDEASAMSSMHRCSHICHRSSMSLYSSSQTSQAAAALGADTEIPVGAIEK